MMFAEAAAAAGLPAKMAYTVRECSKASGCSVSMLHEAVREGDLKSFTPPGRVRGRLVKPEWFDDWFERGTE